MVKKKEGSDEVTYPLSTLRENCKTIFGVEKEIFDGVFHCNSLSEEITKQEAQNRINEWLGKEV